MDAFMIAILMVWVLYWVLYCMFSVAGVHVPAFLSSPTLMWIGASLITFYILYKFQKLIRNRLETYHIGDHVVYRTVKHSNHPGPRAEDIWASPRGEGYTYAVKKLWTVISVSGNKVEVITNRGKHHFLDVSDPSMHKVGIIENLIIRLKWHKHFPEHQQTG